jgi:hypothetical protein
MKIVRLSIASIMLTALCLPFSLLHAQSTTKAAGHVQDAEKLDLFLTQYCTDCHSKKTREGKIRLDNLQTLSKESLVELLGQIEEQVYLKNMPPKDEDQPSLAEQDVIIDSLKGLYQELGTKSEFREKLKSPGHGNYVDHDKLFSGDYKHLKGSSPARRWLISPYIFNDKVNAILGATKQGSLDGKSSNLLNIFATQKIPNPFSLSNASGVSYYDNSAYSGGQLLTMLGASREITYHMTSMRHHRSRGVKAMGIIMKLDDDQRQALNKRKEFLDRYCDVVLADIYGVDDEKFSANFEITKITKEFIDQAKKDHPAGSRDIDHLISTAFRKHATFVDDKVIMLGKCESFWINLGLDRSQIDRALTQSIRDYDKLEKSHKKVKDAYRPLSQSEMEIISRTIKDNRKKGDLHYQIVEKCMKQWESEFNQNLIKTGAPSDELLTELIIELYEKIYNRKTRNDEIKNDLELIKTYISQTGILGGISQYVQTLLLKTEFVYRSEFPQTKADADGRRMLTSTEASYAIAYALTDQMPDSTLKEAANTGRLETREDFKREVKRLLAIRSQLYAVDPKFIASRSGSAATYMPIRKVRFFRQFFGYANAIDIFKDESRVITGDHIRNIATLVGEADRLLVHILKKDRHVFEELLGTEEFYVYHTGDNEAMLKGSIDQKKLHVENYDKTKDNLKDLDWKAFTLQDLDKHHELLKPLSSYGYVNNSGWRQAFLKEHNITDKRLRYFHDAMKRLALLGGDENIMSVPLGDERSPISVRNRMNARYLAPNVVYYYNFDLASWDYPTVQPTKISHRKGILTHPAWLIAHSANTETDPVRRGKWIREKLLAGKVPDVPITVDANIPEDHHKSLRERLHSATNKQECWKCHKHMNPLGYAFEMYDDFGRYRTEEVLENEANLVSKTAPKIRWFNDMRNVYKSTPVNTKGYLAGTGDKNLDGPVKDAVELMGRLAKSARVRQSIIRHAFRYFMGRNETLSDSKTLIDAEQAYLRSDGSFDAVILSLLTSDSFIYRKTIEE